MLKWWNGWFPYWIRNHFLTVRDLKFSLGKSGRFRTSGSPFWSRSTGGRFDRFRMAGQSHRNQAFCKEFIKNQWNSLLKSTIIPKTLIIPGWLKHSARGCAENHCNSSLKWTQIRQTLTFVSRLKHVLKKTLYFLAQNEREDTPCSGRHFVTP